MEIFAPKYYYDFQCIASACPDSCCKEWAVDVDADSAAYYRSVQGELGDRLRTVLKDEDGSTVMAITEGRCPMWRQDGLCQIQAQLGHDALCKTCQEFPRLRHDYGNFAELGLELSCPEAARLILTADGCMVATTVPGGKDAEYDAEVMTILRKSRGEMLEFLEASSYPLPQTLAIILLHAHSVQAQIDGGESVPFTPDECLADARQFAGDGDMGALFDFFGGLEILTPRWKARLGSIPASAPWTAAFRALARYCINRYWLQAVSDYDLVSRVKLALAACLLVNALGGNVIETAQLFSKEIENDPDNVYAILDGCYTCPALTDANLLGLLVK